MKKHLIDVAVIAVAMPVLVLAIGRSTDVAVTSAAWLALFGAVAWLGRSAAGVRPGASHPSTAGPGASPSSAGAGPSPRSTP